MPYCEYWAVLCGGGRSGQALRPYWLWSSWGLLGRYGSEEGVETLSEPVDWEREILENAPLLMRSPRRML